MRIQSRSRPVVRREEVAPTAPPSSESVRARGAVGRRVQLDVASDRLERAGGTRRDWQEAIAHAAKDARPLVVKNQASNQGIAEALNEQGLAPRRRSSGVDRQRAAAGSRPDAKPAHEAEKAQEGKGAVDPSAETRELALPTPAADYSAVEVTLPSRGEFLEHIPEHVQKHEHFATNKDKGAELVAGDPPGQGKIRWNDEHVVNTNEYGKKTGALNDAIVQDSVAAADEVMGGADYDKPAKKVAPEELAKHLAARLPAEKLDGPQFLGAMSYINSAPNEGAQRDRIAMSLQAFQTMDKAGTPPMSRMQLEADLHFNSKVPWHTSHDYSVKDLKEKHSEVLNATYTPGEHKVKLKGSRTLELKNDESGKNLDTKIDKKSTWDKIKDVAKKALPIILTVASFIPGVNAIAIPLNAAYSAYNAAKALKNGNILGAIAGIAGAVTGGITAVAGKALSGVAQTVSKVAGTVAKVAGGAEAILNGYKNKNWGSVLGGIAGIAGGVAGAISNGASQVAKTAADVAKWAERGATAYGAYDAARNGDYLGAVGIGAGLAGDIAGERGNTTWENRFGKVETAAYAGRAVKSAVDNKDYLGAAAGLTDYLASTRGEGTQARKNLETAATVFRSAGAIDRAIDDKDYLGAAAAATKLANELTGRAGFDRASRLLDDASTLKSAVDSKDAAAMARAAWDLANTVKDVSREVHEDRVKPILDAEPLPVTGKKLPEGAGVAEPLPTTGATLPEGAGVRAPAGTYVTKSGDDLGRIAQREMGSASRWPELYAYNRNVLGNDPNVVRPGTALVIPPRDYRLPAAERRAIMATAQRKYDEAKAAREASPAKDPSVVDGGKPAAGGGTTRTGRDYWFHDVAPADEAKLHQLRRQLDNRNQQLDDLKAYKNDLHRSYGLLGFAPLVGKDIRAQITAAGSTIDTLTTMKFDVDQAIREGTPASIERAQKKMDTYTRGLGNLRDTLNGLQEDVYEKLHLGQRAASAVKHVADVAVSGLGAATGLPGKVISGTYSSLSAGIEGYFEGGGNEALRRAGVDALKTVVSESVTRGVKLDLGGASDGVERYLGGVVGDTSEAIAGAALDYSNRQVQLAAQRRAGTLSTAEYHEELRSARLAALASVNAKLRSSLVANTALLGPMGSSAQAGLAAAGKKASEKMVQLFESQFLRRIA